MNSASLYLIHLVAFVAGIVVLWSLRRGEVSWAIRAGIGILMCAAMAVFMFRISEPPHLFADFYKAYYPAGKSILAMDGGAGLAKSMREGASGFVNLPILAWLFAPFGLFSSPAAGYVFFFLRIVATIVAWYSLSRLAGLDRDRSLLLLFVFSSCGPLLNSLREGNTTHFILLMLVAGLWAMRWNRQFLAGLIFGLAALIKLPLLLLGIYFVARGRWRVGMGGAVICLFTGIASLVMFGWDLHVHWYEYSVKPFAETPMAAFNVQSVQAFFARFQHGGAYLKDWSPHAVEPMIRVLSKLTVFSVLGAVALVIGVSWYRRRALVTAQADSPIIELETSVIVMVAMMISTVSWSHYYLWALLPAALLIGGRPLVLSLKRVRIPGWVGLIGVLPPVISFRSSNSLLSSFHAYVAVSHYLLSTVLLLVVFLVALLIAAPAESKPDRK